MIYLDHAATSWPKPPPVLEAMQYWLEELGVSAGRGNSARCAEVDRIVGETRHWLGERCGLPASRIAFTSGATESLNLFLRGALRQGDRVLTTALEHSSVVRPLNALRDELGLHVDVVAPDSDGRVSDIEERLAAGDYRLLVFSHAGNVLGAALPAADLCAAARRHGCLTLLDASQTVGLLSTDVGADAIAASAHKHLLGPPGLGFLGVRSDVSLRAGKQGGTGSAQALDRHPEEWPAFLEAGTPNTPAIFGLHAALRWSDEHAGDALAAGLELVDQLRAGLPGHARILGPSDGERIPILSFTLPDLDPAEAGAVFAEAGIHVRTGFHCAPWLHAHLGTANSGTVRISPGPFNSADDVDRVVAALG